MPKILSNNYCNFICYFILIYICSAISVAQAVDKSFDIKTGQQTIGKLYHIKSHQDDTFVKIATEFNLGYEELLAANHQQDPWYIKGGKQITLPAHFILPKSKKKGIHLNLAEYRIYYFPEDDATTVWTFPVSIGRGDWQTPRGQVIITDKIINPIWYPTESIRKEHEFNEDPLPLKVLAGPDNPLGKFALKLSAKSYFIHGTNRPYGIGMEVTHGCIRLRPDDIKLLFNMVSRKNEVFITYEPFKYAIEDGKLYFEAHHKQNASDEENAQEWMKTIKAMLNSAEKHNQLIDWKILVQLIKDRSGIPQVITLDAGVQETILLSRSTTQITSVKSNYIF